MFRRCAQRSADVVVVPVVAADGEDEIGSDCRRKEEEQNGNSQTEAPEPLSRSRSAIGGGGGGSLLIRDGRTRGEEEEEK